MIRSKYYNIILFSRTLGVTSVAMMALLGQPSPGFASFSSATGDDTLSPDLRSTVVESAASKGSKDNDDFRFDLKVEDKAVAKKGVASALKVQLSAKEPWHVNMAFPTSLNLESPSGIKLEKPKLGKGDAVRLDEKGLEFEIKFTPTSAGKQKISGKLRFAICKAESCSPVTKTVNFEVDVK